MKHIWESVQDKGRYTKHSIFVHSRDGGGGGDLKKKGFENE